MVKRDRRESGENHRFDPHFLHDAGRSSRARRNPIARIGGIALIGATSLVVASGTAGASGSKSPILIGGIVGQTDFSGTDVGFDARIAQLDRSGGIDGHPVKFVGTLDDGSNPSTDLADVQKLILDDHVVAIAPVASNGFLSASEAFAESTKTPYVGWGFLPAFCGSKWGYGFNGCLASSTALNTSIAEPAVKYVSSDPAKVRVAILANSNASGINDRTLYRETFSTVGAKVVYDEAILPVTGVTDYSSYVQDLLATHPNLIVQSMTFAQVAGFVSALRAAGYTGASVDYQTYVPGLLAAEPTLATALKGELIDAQIPPQEGNSEAVKQIAKALAAIGKPTMITEGESVGYWTADVLIQMLQAAAKTGRPITGKSIEQTVNGGFTYKPTLTGAIGDAKFPQSETSPVPCATLLQVSGDLYKVIKNFSCYATVKAMTG
jgi:branched-chain amino acid transport system substrate-binding protein